MTILKKHSLNVPTFASTVTSKLLVPILRTYMRCDSLEPVSSRHDFMGQKMLDIAFNSEASTLASCARDAKAHVRIIAQYGG